MTKNFFIFLILLLFVGGALYLFLRKGAEVREGGDRTSPSASATATPTTSVNTTTRPDGLQIQDIKIGTGQEARKGDAISVHYIGTLENGQKFDSSYDRNEPALFTVGVGRLIKGWDEGIPGMKVGGKRRLVVPGPLAYGEQGNGPIPPNATLIFEVELLDVLPAPQQ